MRRYWPTLLLALLLAGLAGYVYWVELPAERTKAREEAREARLVPFEQDAITALSLRSPTVDLSLARADGGDWMITDPVRTPADAGEVRALLRALVLGRVQRVVEQHPADLEPFGLDPGSVVLTVTAGTEQERIRLGDSGPLTATLYALRETDSRVLLTDLAPKDFLNKTLRTFRQKEILTFDRARVERIRLTYPPTEFVLYRVARGNKDAWQIRYPIETLADDIAVKQLLFRLEALEAMAFVDPGPEHDRLARMLQEPVARITLHADGEDKELSLFRVGGEEGQAYARAGADGPIYLINPFSVTELTKDLFALRDKRLLGIEREDLAILEVRTRTDHYVLVDQGGTWILEDRPDAPLDRQTVDLFVSRVAGLPAEIQVVKRPAALAPYGLASPRADFRATSKRGKTTRLILGKKGGGLVYAKGGGLPGIYQARADILDQIPAPEDLIAEAGPDGDEGP